MWIENTIFKEDLERINRASFIDWAKFDGKTFFVTGGTGLIGYTFICALLYRNLIHHSRIHVIALVRDMKNAQEQFKSVLSDSEGALKFVSGSIEAMPHVGEHIDFILHGASPTDSRYFVEHPLETLETAIQGTSNMLHLAEEKQVKKMVYLSSMEVYGDHQSEDKISEEEVVCLHPMNLRDSYPIGKCASENLCQAYCHERGISVDVLRLSQVIGTTCPVRKSHDTRIVMEIARDILSGSDIVLKTKGESKRTYVYVADAVTAILKVLTCEGSDVYNVANEETYCSIYDMCQLAAEKVAGGKIKVVVQEKDEGIYPAANCLNLSNEKLRACGWKSNTGLEKMFKRLIHY